jgi:type IV secretory pathway protease TraF
LFLKTENSRRVAESRSVCVGLYARENAPLSPQMWCIIFPREIKLIQNLQISRGYIFRILQHFAAKLCNFTDFNMLFLAEVMDFVLLS